MLGTHSRRSLQGWELLLAAVWETDGRGAHEGYYLGGPGHVLGDRERLCQASNGGEGMCDSWSCVEEKKTGFWDGSGWRGEVIGGVKGDPQVLEWPFMPKCTWRSGALAGACGEEQG